MDVKEMSQMLQQDEVLRQLVDAVICHKQCIDGLNVVVGDISRCLAQAVTMLKYIVESSGSEESVDAFNTIFKELIQERFRHDIAAKKPIVCKAPDKLQ